MRGACYVRPDTEEFGPLGKGPGCVNNVTRVSLPCLSDGVCLTRLADRISGTAGFGAPGEEPVELIGKRLALALTERRRPPCVDPASAQLIQEVTH